MTDEALRALERDARARPDDRAAAWAYARGLERAGERRALWLELCRMSRAGDDDASRAVDGWVPGLGGTTPPVLASLRAPKVERVSLVRDEAFRSDRVLAVVTAPDGSLLLLAGEGLVAVDRGTEQVIWKQAGVATLMPCGDDALIVTRERSAFLRQGGGLESSSGAGLIGSGMIHSGVVRGDRLVVKVFPGTFEAFDVGDALGRLLWRQGGRGVPAQAGEVTLFVGDDECEARDLERGTALWERTGAEHGELPYVWWDCDRADFLFHTWAEHGARTTSLDPRTGSVRWSVTHARAERLVALAPGVFVVEPDEAHLVAYVREDGRLAWSYDLLPSDTTVVYATTGDALYVASAVGQVLRLLVLELGSGAVRATATGRLPREGTACAVWVRAESVEVLLALHDDQIVIVRFAD